MEHYHIKNRATGLPNPNISTCQLSTFMYFTACVLADRQDAPESMKVFCKLADVSCMNGLWNMNARACARVCSACCCHTRQRRRGQAMPSRAAPTSRTVFDIRLQTGLSPAKNSPRGPANRMHMTEFWQMADRSGIVGPPSVQGLFPCRQNSTCIPKTVTVVPVATTWPT